MAESKSGSSKSRRRLGRGLQSLLTDPVEVPVEIEPTTSRHVEQKANTEPEPAASGGDVSTPAAGAGRRSDSGFGGGVRPATGPDDAGSPASTPAEPSASMTAIPAAGVIPAAGTEHAAGPVHPTSGGDLRSVPLATIVPNPRQPRRHFDEASIASLAESIRTAGLMQPIVVRPAPAAPGGTEGPRYEIVAGERRYRAAATIPLEQVPVIVRDVDDRTAAELALIENLQREDLNPIERAAAFRRLADDFGMTHESIAEAVGLDRASISNHLRLLGLDEATLADLRSGRLGMGHGRALLAIEGITPRRSLAEQAIRDGWSVRELERRVRSFLRREQDTASTPDDQPDLSRSHLDDLERRLGEHLGTRVHVRPGRKKGTGEVRIQFFSHEEFEGLLSRVGFRLP